MALSLGVNIVGINKTGFLGADSVITALICRETYPDKVISKVLGRRDASFAVSCSYPRLSSGVTAAGWEMHPKIT